MPESLRLILGGVLLLAGLLLLTIAVLGARGALRRNRVAGIRTPATLRSDRAFVVGHRAAALPLGAAAVVALLGGVVLLVPGGSAGPLGWVVLAIATVGTLVLTGVGGLVGDRAAVAVVNGPPDPNELPEPVAACAGTCVGCDLVAGCRDATVAREV